MSLVNTSSSPYFDLYDKSKRFIKYLGVAGRPDQAREYTEIQSLFLDLLKRLGDTSMHNGSVVSGCDLTVVGNNAVIGAGKIYFDGIVYDVPTTPVAITKSGKELIGVSVNQTIVTTAEDTSLYDPVYGLQGVSMAGADRIKSELVYSVNNPSAVTVHILFDGDLYIDNTRPELDVISDLLARRTYDESGNYKVYGLGVSVTDYDTDHMQLIVESGKAYIRGYEVIKPTPTKRLIPKAQDTFSVTSEGIRYDGSTRFLLGWQPVKQITEVTATVEVTTSISRGMIPGGLDTIPTDPEISVSSIVSIDGYSLNTDYTRSGNQVNWAPEGSEPSPGSSYNITWRYSKTFEIGTEVALELFEGAYYVKFLTASVPVLSTESYDSYFYVDYDYYLYRIDAITINKTGDIEVISGQSGIAQQVSTPRVNSSDVLELGTLKFSPNSSDVSVTYLKTSRLTMADLQGMLLRVEDMEYNQAVDALDADAMSGESPTNLKGVFSDGFISLAKANLTHDLFDCLYDVDNNWIMPSRTDTVHYLALDTTSGTFTAQKNKLTVTSDYSEVVTLSQLSASKSMLINPYATYNKKNFLELSPAIDNFVHNEYIYTNTARTVRLTGSTSARWSTSTTSVTKVTDEVMQYMRQIEVNITGQNFVAGTDNLACTFDDIPVFLTATGTTIAGTTDGTVKADANGEFTAKFTIPENVKTGTREVKVTNANNGSSAAFTSRGIMRTTTLNTATTTFIQTEVDMWGGGGGDGGSGDPLAQAFILPEDGFITSIGVFFTAKDSSAINVAVEVRNMINGYPGQTVYGRKIVHSSDIVSNQLGATETKVTFDDPIFCSGGESYCFVLLTDSASHGVAIAELGAMNLDNSGYITNQPYIDGIMFSSSNAISWTPHNDMDIKFKIYTANFTGHESSIADYVEWDSTGSDFDMLALSASVFTPPSTKVNWEVSINSGAWTPIETFVNRDLVTLANKIRIRAKLFGTATVSPVIYYVDTNVTASKSELSAVYISRNMTTSQGFTTIRQSAEMYLPSGTSGSLQFSVDAGNTWITPTIVGSPTPITEEFYQYQYTHTLETEATQFMSRINMSSNSNLIKPRARRLMNIMK